MSLHFKLKHNQDRETRVYLGDALSPKGLNIELDINSFISDR